MIIGSQQRLGSLSYEPKIIINGHQIKRVYEKEVLGIVQLFHTCENSGNWAVPCPREFMVIPICYVNSVLSNFIININTMMTIC